MDKRDYRSGQPWCFATHGVLDGSLAGFVKAVHLVRDTGATAFIGELAGLTVISRSAIQHGEGSLIVCAGNPEMAGWLLMGWLSRMRSK